MLLVVCSLRSHFIKHLSHTSLISTTLHAHRLLSLTPYSHILTSSDSVYQLKSRLSFNNLFTVNATSSSSPETPTVVSSTSPYLSVHVRCTRYFADMLSEALLCFGASSTSIDEQDSYDQNEEICISSIYAISQDVHKSILHAADSIGLKDTPSYEVVMAYHSDWIKETQESFHPVEVTEGLWIVPEWRTPPVWSFLLFKFLRSLKQPISF